MKIFLLLFCFIFLKLSPTYAMICPTPFPNKDEILKYVEKVTQYNDIQFIDEYDFNHDGINDSLAYSPSECGNAGCNYYIFLKEKDGEYRLSGDAFFHKDAFLISNGLNKNDFSIFAYRRISADNGALIRYENVLCTMHIKGKIDGKSENLFQFVEKLNAVVN